jgi:predicted metal-dependent HD superfamily phosphohydrolase
LLREESSSQTDAKYHAGQVFFLSALQQRPHLYQTEYFRDRYEAIARANLDRLLAELQAMGYGAAARSTW